MRTRKEITYICFSDDIRLIMNVYRDIYTIKFCVFGDTIIAVNIKQTKMHLSVNILLKKQLCSI